MAEQTADTTSPGRDHLILGTAGHIDHGKSSLVKALTGTDPDRLAEEKRRGITIELGFARLELPDGTVMGVVDVPGHERFVRQMIAGSTGIDVALLCIAADDGIMPQTVEHMAVLELLGIEHCVVALTKTDLVDDDWIAFVNDEIRSRLSSTPYANALIVPTSARTGAGLAELRAALADTGKSVQRARRGSVARFPIDRAFSIKGAGTVVTGTLWSGTVAPGDELELLPGGKRVRIRGAQTHGNAVDVAEAGNRVALNLSTLGTDEVRPGMFLATPGSITPTDRFDAIVTYLGTEEGSSSTLDTGEHVRVAHGTAEVAGRILLMDGQKSLAPKETAYAQIRLDEALPLSRYDRFVIRSMTPVHVMGGGQVLHCHPRRRTNLVPNERMMLDALHAGDEASACDASLGLQQRPATAREIASYAGLNEEPCRTRLDDRAETGYIERLEVEGASAHYATPTLLQSHLSAIENALLTFHADNPTQPGIVKAALQRRFGKRSTTASFDALIGRLQSTGSIIVSNGEISHPRAGAGARRLEEQAAEQFYETLVVAAGSPPAIVELIAEQGLEPSLAHRALGSLEHRGLIQRVGNDYYFTVDALTSLTQAVVEFFRTHDKATAAELKDAMGTSRKYAIPLLEYFDARGLTLREADLRVLNKR